MVGPVDDAPTGVGQVVAIDDRTVLAILDALLNVKVRSGRSTVTQRVSYKALDVEQIGHCRVRVLRFGTERCHDCPLRQQCTTNVDGRSVTLNFREARLQAARAEQARPATRRKLRRRSLVERKLAELKMHGLRQARYHGQRKTLLQLRLTAGMINLKKLFSLQIGLSGSLDA